MIAPTRFGAMAAAFFAAAGVTLSSGVATAGPIDRVVRRNTQTAIWIILTYGDADCASYPVRDFKVTVQPKHGTVVLEKRPFTLDEKTGVCKGTRVDVPWLIYRPAKNYVGPDSVSISWNNLNFTNDTSLSYTIEDFSIYVK